MALTTVPASLSATALTLTTAAQPNITSVGTLTGLTVNGNIGLTKETPVLTLTDSSASRTTQLIADDNNSAVRASGPLLLQSGGSVSAITLDASQNATFAGTLTASDHIYLPDSKVLFIGAAPALSLYHTGTNSHIQNSTGALINTTATFVVNNAANTETMLNAYENGAVSLYYDSAVKLATTSAGIAVTGSGFSNTSTTGIPAIRTSGNYGGAIGLLDTKEAGWYAQDSGDTLYQYVGRASGTAPNASIVMTYKSSGNVGIGETNPQFPLHVKSSGTDIAKFESSGSYTFTRFSSSSRNWAISAGSSFSIYDETASATQLSINSSGYTLKVNGNIDIAQLKGSLGNAFLRFTDGDASADWSIGSDDGSGAGAGAFIIYDRSQSAYRAIINSSGNVGISATPPSHNLGKFLTLNGANLIGVGTSGAYLGYNMYYDSAWKYQAAAASALISFENDGDLTIRQAGSGSAAGAISYSENFHLDAAGHLGLGMDPSQALDINASDGLSLRFYQSGTFKAGLQVADSAGQMVGTSATGDLAIRSQADVVFGAGGNTERMRIKSNGTITVGGDPYEFVDVVYRRAFSLNRAYTQVANINGSGLGSSYEVHVRGTTSSVVVNAHFHIMVGHYYDISIKSFGGAYTDCKVKVVSNGNEDSSLYIGAATVNNSTFTGLVSIRPHDTSVVDMSPSTAYSTCYVEHAQTTTATEETATGSATSGSGPTNAYS